MHKIIVRAVHNGAARLLESYTGSKRNFMLFALEGVLMYFVMNLVNMNNNLFATRLGANPFQLSLVTSLPQTVSMLILIPGAILTDRMKNKRTMLIFCLGLLSALYFAIGFISVLGSSRLYGFIGLLTLSAAPFALYNSSWQAFFADVVSVEHRNHTLSFRSRLTFVIGIAIPLTVGGILSSIPDNEDKIMTHQTLFIIASVILLIQIFTLSRIRGGDVEHTASISLAQLKKVALSLARSKPFMSFVGIALFFYIGWHLDWTMFYYGQVTYLKSSESWLSYANVASALAQFVSIGFWSRLNDKMGVRFTIIIGSLGLALCPLGLLAGTALPPEAGRPVFVALHALFNLPFAIVNLNIIQCLLQVVDLNYKTVSIALYTVLITASNAIFPAVGVQIYEAFGADLRAFQYTFYIIIAIRVVATALFFVRWRMLRNEPK